MPDLVVPIRRIRRHRNKIEDGLLTIEDAHTEKREAILETIRQCGIVITVEAMEPQCWSNICLSTDLYDYRTQYVALEDTQSTILSMIDEFDISDFNEFMALRRPLR